MQVREKYSGGVAKLLIMVLAMLSLLQPFQKDFITAGFYLNRDFIAANFCENQDQPELYCDGICQLKKSLKEAAEQDQEESILHLKLEIQFFETASESIKTVHPTLIKTSTPQFKDTQPTDPLLTAIFKPPIPS